MSVIYSYTKRGRDALVDLIQETHPRLGVMDYNVSFEDPIPVPTDTDPGRTYIEMYLQDRGRKESLYYRRLDMAVAMGPVVSITHRDDRTPTHRSIAEEINRQLGFNLNSRDVDFDRIKVHSRQNPFQFTLKAKPTSYVWYGEVTVEVSLVSLDSVDDVRLMEDGTGIGRLMEDGHFRMLESA